MSPLPFLRRLSRVPLSSLPSPPAVALALVLCAAGPARAQDEVPFITTPDHVTLEMLRMAQVAPGDHVIDLGSGDGRIVITAAARFGATGLGVEIVPDLVAQSQRHAREAGVADRVRFEEQDLFKTDLSPATVVTMYLLPEVNLQLRPALLALRPGTRIVSHDWDMGDWKPDATHVLPVPDKKVGLEKSSKVHLWVVPAPVDGEWCGAGRLAGARLTVHQRFQELMLQLQTRGAPVSLEGRLRGAQLQASGAGGGGPWRMAWEAGRLRVESAPAGRAAWQGGYFLPAAGAACR